MKRILASFLIICIGLVVVDVHFNESRASLKAVAGFNQAAVAITGGFISGVTGVPTVLASSYVDVTAPADTNENILVTIPLAAGQLGANGAVKFRGKFTLIANANAKTLRARLSGIGGTILFTTSQLTSGTQGEIEITVANRNDPAVQVGYGTGIMAGIGAIAVSQATGAVDTTAATTLVITMQKATGTDTVTLNGYTVLLIKP